MQRELEETPLEWMVRPYFSWVKCCPEQCPEGFRACRDFPACCRDLQSLGAILRSEWVYKVKWGYGVMPSLTTRSQKSPLPPIPVRVTG